MTALKVRDLLERLRGVDPDRVVAIAHDAVFDTECGDPECDPDPPCCHFAELDETSFYGQLPVFVLVKGDPIL